MAVRSLTFHCLGFGLIIALAVPLASASPDGGGVAAVNSGGGPDLVLDGWADGLSDTYIYQDRIEVASSDPRTFGFANTGSGTMTLDVAGYVSATRVNTTSNITAGGDNRILIYQDGPLQFRTPAGDPALEIGDDGTLSIPPTVRYKTYSGVCFVPGHSNNDYLVDHVDGSIRTTDAVGPSSHVAHVDLPNGAVVTKITAQFFDESPFSNANLTLKSVSLSDGAVTDMAYVETASETGWQTLTDTTIVASTINNQDYHYFFHLDIPNGQSLNVVFSWVQIEYEATLLAQ